MAQPGASLQSYNMELIKCLEELKQRRDLLEAEIDQDERSKVQIEKDLRVITERLEQVKSSLERKLQRRDDYERTIRETEAAYYKIVESSQTLLSVLRKEANQLTNSSASVGKS